MIRKTRFNKTAVNSNLQALKHVSKTKHFNLVQDQNGYPETTAIITDLIV